MLIKNVFSEFRIISSKITFIFRTSDFRTKISLIRSEFLESVENHEKPFRRSSSPQGGKRQQTTHFTRRGRRKTEKRKLAATRGDLSQAVRTREENMHKALCSEEARRTTRNYPRVRARSGTESKDDMLAFRSATTRREGKN